MKKYTKPTRFFKKVEEVELIPAPKNAKELQKAIYNLAIQKNMTATNLCKVLKICWTKFCEYQHKEDYKISDWHKVLRFKK